MNGKHVRPQNAQGLDRISGAVKNHVRGIEINAQVRAIRRFEEIEQDTGRLLASFEREGLLISRGMVAEPPDYFEHRLIIGIARLVRDKTNMTCDAFHAERGGEIARIQRPLHPRFPRRRRDKTDSPPYGFNIRVAFAFISAHHRDNVKLRPRERRAPVPHGRRAESVIAADAELAVMNSLGSEISQLVASRPEHYADFLFFQIRHITFSPLRLHASGRATPPPNPVSV